LNSTLIVAVTIVTFALIFYSIAVLIEQREGYISKWVLKFLTAGVLFDISSTLLMIMGSRKIPVTIHGFIGYSALTAMLIETILVWRFWRKKGGTPVPRSLNIYTRLAYS